MCLRDNPNLLKQAIEAVKADHPFAIDAIVLLPDHLHCIWTLPQGDNDFSKRWMLIKSKFTRAYDDEFKGAPSSSRREKREQNIWHRRFWEHQIRDEADYKQHVDYIHYNPVAEAPIDWKLSSFHRYVKNGIYHHDWGADREKMLDAAIGHE